MKYRRCACMRKVFYRPTISGSGPPTFVESEFRFGQVSPARIRWTKVHKPWQNRVMIRLTKRTATKRVEVHEIVKIRHLSMHPAVCDIWTGISSGKWQLFFICLSMKGCIRSLCVSGWGLTDGWGKILMQTESWVNGQPEVLINVHISQGDVTYKQSSVRTISYLRTHSHTHAVTYEAILVRLCMIAWLKIKNVWMLWLSVTKWWAILEVL